MGRKRGREILLIPIIIGIIGVAVVLSVMILSHEFGHFIVAKKMGVKVEKFSFGFGPKLASVKRGETEYVLSAVPFGGYVKMAGDELAGQLEGKEWEFYSKPIYKRFNIIAAGSAVNYILGFLLFCFMCMLGEPVITSRIGAVREGYPAEKAGLKKNDIILSINEKKVNSWDDVLNTIHNRKEGDVMLEIGRNGNTLKVTVSGRSEEQKDIFGKPKKVTVIGIEPSDESKFIKYDLINAVKMGAVKTWDLTVMTYQLIWKMLTGSVSPKAVAGPIGIFAIVGRAANMGINYLLYISALISISLAIFNLLPFPILDGGHILFLAIEKIKGRPVSAKAQEVAQNIAFALLIAFMLFVSWNDVANLPRMFK